MMPVPIADIEKFRQHRPADAPCLYREARDLCQHHIVVLQNPTAPEVEEK